MRFVLVLIVWLAGCAHDVHVRYPAAPDEPTGTVVLLMSQAASDVNVEITHNSRIVIANAPAGNQDIILTANGSDKAMRVYIGTDHATTIPLGVPDATSGFLESLFGTLVAIVAYSLLHCAGRGTFGSRV